MRRVEIRATIIFAIPVFLIIAFAAFSFPYAPLEDLPEWIYQGYVFNKLMSGVPSPDFALKDFPVPYALFQAITSVCLLFASPMATARIVVFLYAGVCIYAINRLIARHHLDPFVAWPLLIAAVVLNSPFWNGYMGYEFGLAVIMLYLTLPADAQLDTKCICLFSVLAFFAHGWAFIAIVVFIGCSALFKQRVLAASAGLAPSFVLFIWYEIKSGNSAKLNEFLHVDDVNIVLHKIYTLFKAAPFRNPIVFSFNASEHYGLVFLATGLLIDVAFLLALSILVVEAVRKSGNSILRRPELLAGVLLMLLAVILPPTGFGMANPGERVMYPALILLVIAVFAGVESPPLPKAVLTSALAAGIALFALGLSGASVAYQAEAASSNSSKSPPIAISRNLLFGHRLVQFDKRMRNVEQAWHQDAMPTMPLEFETALISPKNQ